MEELKQDGWTEPTPGGSGGIKDIFEVCGINERAAFDGSVGGG